jgi:hypothetical protein
MWEGEGNMRFRLLEEWGQHEEVGYRDKDGDGEWGYGEGGEHEEADYRVRMRKVGDFSTGLLAGIGELWY